MSEFRISYSGCPLCGSVGEFRRAADCHQHPLYRTPLPKQITWLECSVCHHVYTDGYFTNEALAILFSESNASQTVGQNIEADRYVWSDTVDKVSLLRQSNEGRWLDVGFGSGNLLLTACEYGYEVVGTDLRRANVEALRALGLEAHSKDILEIDSQNKYDVVSMADVLEHMPFPKMVLEHVYKLLNPGGTLFLSMPNMEAPLWLALDRDDINPYWGELEHYHNFGRTRLYSLLRELGFEIKRYGVNKRYRVGMEVIATLPKVFDSYGARYHQ